MPDPLAFHDRTVSDPMLPRPFRLVDRRQETADTATLWLRPNDGHVGYRFEPAQIGMVGLPGLGEVPISFSSDPDAADLAMTIRAAGAITSALCALDVGGVVTLRGPYGRPWPMPERGALLIVVGGLGLAPLRAVLLEAVRRPEVTVRLAYGSKTPHDMLFQSDLEAWAAELDIHVVVEQPSDTWRGRVGRVTSVLGDALDGWDDPTVFMCGPDPMMAAVGPALVAGGVAPSRLWVTLERNMKCSIGLCGHCQFGRFFVCKDGPVFGWPEIAALFDLEEI